MPFICLTLNPFIINYAAPRKDSASELTQIRKDSLNEARKDSVTETTVRKDSVAESMPRKDSVTETTVRKDSVAESMARKDSLQPPPTTDLLALSPLPSPSSRHGSIFAAASELGAPTEFSDVVG